MLVVTSLCIGQESVLLRLNHNAGDQYLIAMDIEQEGMMSMHMDMSMAFLEKKDTVYSVEMGFEKVAMTMNQNGMEMSYDSSISEENMDDIAKMMHTQFAPMLEAKIYSTMTHRADTYDFRIEPNIPNAGDMADKASAVVFPKEALKVGDSWTENKIENGMDMTMVYTIKSIEADVVLIDLSGTISLLAEGTISGSLEVDKATGNVNSSIMDMQMSAEGQQISTHIKMTSTKQ